LIYSLGFFQTLNAGDDDDWEPKSLNPEKRKESTKRINIFTYAKKERERGKNKMLELSFIYIFLFIFLNIITMVKRIPIFAFILSIFTIWFTTFYIFPDTTLLSYRIPLTLFILLTAISNLLVNTLELNQKWISKDLNRQIFQHGS
jgi:hypothetical protein